MKISRSGKKEDVVLGPGVKFAGLSDIKLKEFRDGSLIVIVLEQVHLNPNL